MKTNKNKDLFRFNHFEIITKVTQDNRIYRQYMIKSVEINIFY